MALKNQLIALESPMAYKNEIWTRIQRVNIDAPEQVEVHKISGDIKQALEDLLDEEQFDDEGPELLFDADAFKEPAVGLLREQFSLTEDEMQRFEKMAKDIRQDALVRAAELKKEEDILVDLSEVNETIVTGALHDAFVKYQERWKAEKPLQEVEKTRKHIKELSPADISAIVDSERVELLSHDSIAAKHNVTTALAGRIIRAAKKNSDFISVREQK